MTTLTKLQKYRSAVRPPPQDDSAARNRSLCALSGLQYGNLFSARPIQKRIRRALAQHIRFASALAGRLIGRSVIQPLQPAADPQDLIHGLTIILPGIEAIGPYPEEIRAGLRDGRVPGAIHIFQWGVPFPEGYFRNLMDIRRNRRQAAALAAIILAHQNQYPRSPIHLVANSGGAGPALMAIEMLPLDCPITGLAIVAGAVSCGYNLQPVLTRCSKGVINVYSHRDAVMLNIGTRIFGTADRKFAASCGYRGFTMRSDKLQQMAWAPAYGPLYGWWGTHGTSTSREFISCHIARWIKASATTANRHATFAFERPL
jgi:hypothetical protein